MPGATKFDRILIVAIGALLALFTFGTVSAMVTSATADDASGKRNDDAVEIEVVEEDDDADPLARGDSNSGGGDSRSGNSGSRSIGSHSGNTATGTTKNTGVSKSVSNSSGKSKHTATGTTRGTGASKSVSNSS